MISQLKCVVTKSLQDWRHFLLWNLKSNFKKHINKIGPRSTSCISATDLRHLTLRFCRSRFYIFLLYTTMPELPKWSCSFSLSQ